MRAMTVNVYPFSELSDEAKQKAKDDYAANFGYAWGNEALESMKKLAEHFGGRVSNYSIDWFNSSYSSMSFDMPELEPEEVKERLEALGTYEPKTLKGHGDCKLTGVCHDEDAIDGFRIAYIRDGERGLDKLMQAAYKNWLTVCQGDCEYQYGDEEFAEHCDANEYEFTKNGEPA